MLSVRIAATVPAFLLCLAASVGAQEPVSDSSPAPVSPVLSSPGPTGTFIVRLGMATGASVPFQAEIRLYSYTGFLLETVPTRDNNAPVVLNQVPLGEYRIEAVIPGYARAEDVATLPYRGAMTYVFLNLRPEAGPAASAGTSALPMIAPKARAEIQKGLEALRSKNFKEAQRRLERAFELAPGHPTVNYLVGVLYLRLNDLSRARTHLEKAAAMNSNHAATLAALGNVLHRLADYPAVIEILEKALVLDANSWQGHWTIADAYYRQRQFEKARVHAERALELAPDKAPQVQLLLALALDALGQREKAKQEVESFLSRHPDHPRAATARLLLERMREKPVEAAPASAPPVSSDSAAAASLLSSPLEAELPAGRWAPPDVDEEVPAVAPDVGCSVPDVRTAAGRRVVALVENLQRFTATDRVEHVELDAAGKPGPPQARKFNYVVSISELRPGTLSVEESLEALPSPGSFSTRLVTTGLAALALIFHPYYVEDFNLRCEGLGQWRGEPVWQLYFRQRDDRPSRVLLYKTVDGRFPLKLKGRAWVAANSYQILRLEMDLVEPVKSVNLQREHLIIEYQPVEFTKSKVRLWLPSSAELYAHARGRRFHHRHSFSDYLLFSVKANQEIQKPADP